MRGVIHDIFTQISGQWKQVTEFIGGLTPTEVTEFTERLVDNDAQFVGYSALQLWYSRLESDVATVQRLCDGLDHIGRADLAGRDSFYLITFISGVTPTMAVNTSLQATEISQAK